ELAEPNLSLRVLRALRLISRSRLRSTWRAFPVLFLTPAQRHQAFALIEPHLDPDLTVGRVRLGKSVIDVGAQGLQRQLPVQVPLRPRDFGAVQTAGHANLDAACAEPERGFHGFSHRAAERHALLELHGDRFGNQLGIELGFLDFLNVDEDLAARPLLDLLFQLVDFGALTPDDDAGAGCVNVDLQPVDGALGFDFLDARVD